MNDKNQLSDTQSKLAAWHEWNNQSSEYKLAHTEPPKPKPLRWPTRYGNTEFKKRAKQILRI